MNAPTQFRDNCSAALQTVRTHCTLPRYSGSSGYQYECYSVPYILVTDEGACDRAWTRCASEMKSHWQAECTQQGLASAEVTAANAASVERLQSGLINLLRPVASVIADLAHESYVADVSPGRAGTRRVGRSLAAMLAGHTFPNQASAFPAECRKSRALTLQRVALS